MKLAISSRIEEIAQRERTGRGCHVDVPLLDVQAGLLANQALSYFTTDKSPRRMGNSHPVVVPYQVFPVADGHIIIASGNDNQFAKLCSVLGEPTLAIISGKSACAMCSSARPI